ncbi:MAG: hypothetical protein KJ571_17740 [Bacteroidetes bacterium]|nr:hypothetical protein [Bacteroidota bacterium]
MKRQLFKNYSYQFDKNERKLITTFCKQVVGQMNGDERFYGDIRAYNSIIEKLNSGAEEVKLTKEEKTKLVLQLKENIKHIRKTMEKSWFIKRWLYKSMLGQYINILSTHFEE